jgi:hypothetical protein
LHMTPASVEVSVLVPVVSHAPDELLLPAGRPWKRSTEAPAAWSQVVSGLSKMHGKVGVHEVVASGSSKTFPTGDGVVDVNKVGVDGARRSCASIHGMQHSSKGWVSLDLRAAVSWANRWLLSSWVPFPIQKKVLGYQRFLAS